MLDRHFDMEHSSIGVNPYKSFHGNCTSGTPFRAFPMQNNYFPLAAVAGLGEHSKGLAEGSVLSSFMVSQEFLNVKSPYVLNRENVS